MNFHSNSNFARGFGRGGIRLDARRGQALTADELARWAPAVFRTEAHSSRSEKFRVIPTHDLLAALDREGFVPVRAQVGGSRDEEKRGFTKHLLRLRRRDDLTRPPAVGDVYPEVVLVNAHDGTSCYKMLAGLFRLVCSNGMVVAKDNFGSVRVGHSGAGVLDKVIEGTYRVIDDATRAIAHAEHLRTINVSPDEARVYGEAALRLRFSEEKLPAISGEEITRPVRAADAGGNLWTVFNAAQERLVRGGTGYRHENERGRVTYRATRPVNSAEGDIKLNSALWHLTTEFAALKGRALAA